MADFLEDGYTADFYVAAAPDGLHGPVKGKCRPPLGRVCDPITAAFLRDDFETFWAKAPKVLATAIVEWDQLDSKGNPVAITEPNLQRIHHIKLQKLWLRVVGQVANDPEPDGTQAPKTNTEADSKN